MLLFTCRYLQTLQYLKILERTEEGIFYIPINPYAIFTDSVPLLLYLSSVVVTLYYKHLFYN